MEQKFGFTIGQSVKYVISHEGTRAYNERHKRPAYGTIVGFKESTVEVKFIGESNIKSTIKRIPPHRLEKL